jgi:O-antigen/teichoic acid export membrane protein
MMGVAVLFPSLFPIVIAYFAGWCVIRGALLIYTLRTFPPNDVQDPEAVPYGKHLTVMKGASVIAASLGSIFLFHISAVQLAVYSIAVAPIEQMRGMLNNVESLVLPKFSQDSWDVWNWRTLVRKSGPLFAVLGVGIVVYVLAAPYLYAILFHKYIAAIPYTQVWAFSLLLTALSVLLGAILRARKEVKKLYIFNVASITSTFLFIGPLTYFYGIWGLLGAQYAVKTVETITFCYLTSWNPRFAEKSAQSSDGENGTNANA